jgi:hypothetical protein
MLILLPATSGCSLFLTKEKPQITDTFCAKYLPFPDDQESKKYFLNSPVKMFEWAKVNETTAICDCKPTPQLREKCWQKFIKLNEK